MVLLTEKMLAFGSVRVLGSAASGAHQPRRRRRWSGPPFTSLGHAEPWSGSDFGFPASSPVRPGACGWVREVFCPFSVGGGLTAPALPQPWALGTVGAA